jgi:hypothetical protein
MDAPGKVGEVKAQEHRRLVVTAVALVPDETPHVRFVGLDDRIEDYATNGRLVAVDRDQHRRPLAKESRDIAGEGV